MLGGACNRKSRLHFEFFTSLMGASPRVGDCDLYVTYGGVVGVGNGVLITTLNWQGFEVIF